MRARTFNDESVLKGKSTSRERVFKDYFNSLDGKEPNEEDECSEEDEIEGSGGEYSENENEANKSEIEEDETDKDDPEIEDEIESGNEGDDSSILLVYFNLQEEKSLVRHNIVIRWWLWVKKTYFVKSTIQSLCPSSSCPILSSLFSMYPDRRDCIHDLIDTVPLN